MSGNVRDRVRIAYKRVKDSISILKSGYYLRLLRNILARRPHIVLFYPHTPKNHKYTIFQICNHLGLRATNNPKAQFITAMRWEDATFKKVSSLLNQIHNNKSVININSVDISKTRVDLVFREVFGYSSMIDPLTFEGVCVRKSDINAQHDGRIVPCPILKKEKGFIYQKLINNRFDDAFTREIRAPVIGKRMPFIFLKYKPLTDRFKVSVKGEIAQPEDFLSAAEMHKIFAFCEKIGMDFGELDILRDRDENKLYIVDANDTPMVHFAGFSKGEVKYAYASLVKSFQQAFLDSRWSKVNRA